MALGAGLVVGLLLNATIADAEWVRTWLLDGLLNVVGESFVRLLSMLVVPIVFVSLITGVSSLADPTSLGRVGGRAIGLYLITTGLAIMLALSAGQIFQTGVGASPAEMETPEISAAPSFTEVMINLVPSNPVEAMAEGNMLPIIVFRDPAGPGDFSGRQVGPADLGTVLRLDGCGHEAGRHRHADRAVRRVRADHDHGCDHRLGNVRRGHQVRSAGAGDLDRARRGCLSDAAQAVHRAESHRVLPPDSRRAGLRVFHGVLGRHDSRNAARGSGAAGREQSHQLFYRTTGRDDQHGRHCHHAGYCGRVHRPVLRRRPQPDAIS